MSHFQRILEMLQVEHDRAIRDLQRQWKAEVEELHSTHKQELVNLTRKPWESEGGSHHNPWDSEGGLVRNSSSEGVQCSDTSLVRDPSTECVQCSDTALVQCSDTELVQCSDIQCSDTELLQCSDMEEGNHALKESRNQKFHHYLDCGKGIEEMVSKSGSELRVSPMRGMVSSPSEKPHSSMVSDSCHILRENLKNTTFVAEGSGQVFQEYIMAKGWDKLPVRVPHSTCVRKVVSHEAFDPVCALAIVLNTALLGATVSFKASTLGTEPVPLHYRVLNTVCSCWFIVELTLRMTSEGCLIFWCSSSNKSWNIFDTFVVAFDIMDQVVELALGSESKELGNLSITRILKVLRIARALRVVRLLEFCTELRLMTLLILKSGSSVIWSMILLFMIFFVFGNFFMQAVTEHLTAENLTLDQLDHLPQDSLEGKLHKHFGSLVMTSYTLFQSVSGGVSWCELADPLLEIGTLNGVVFCTFIFFTVFAMLNIITGFFVESAFASAARDHDEVIHEQMSSENSAMKSLHRLFLEWDSENTGKISQIQFASLAEDPRANALLRDLGLHVTEAKGLFALLDLEQTGFVSIDDFIIGCMRLRGGAQELDLVSLMYENRKMSIAQKKFRHYVAEEFEKMHLWEARVKDNFNALKILPHIHGMVADLVATSAAAQHRGTDFTCM